MGEEDRLRAQLVVTRIAAIAVPSLLWWARIATGKWRYIMGVSAGAMVVCCSLMWLAASKQHGGARSLRSFMILRLRNRLSKLSKTRALALAKLAGPSVANIALLVLLGENVRLFVQHQPSATTTIVVFALNALCIAGLLWMFTVYRQHRIAEHERQKAFPAAIELVESARQRLREVNASSPDEMRSIVQEFVASVRESLALLHGSKDYSEDVSVWVKGYNSPSNQFHYWTSSFSDSLRKKEAEDNADGFCSEVFSIVTDSVKSTSVLSYGSVCGYAIFGRSNERPQPTQLPLAFVQESTKHCWAFTDGYIDGIRSELRPGMRIRSYIRCTIRVPGRGDMPESIGASAFFPLFACHPKENYFTQYDSFIVQLAAGELQRFIARNSGALEERRFLRVGQRMLIACTFDNEHEVPQSALGTPIRTSALPSHKTRASCEIASFEEGVRALERSEALEFQSWKIRSLSDDAIVAYEVAGSHFDAVFQYDAIGARASAQYVTSVFGLALFCRAVEAGRELGFHSSDTVFFHLSAGALLYPECAEVLAWARSSNFKVGLILHEIDDRNPATSLRNVVEQVAKEGVSVCHQIRTRSDLQAAQAAGVRWFKVAPDLALAITTSEAFRIDFSRICAAATEDVVIIVPSPEGGKERMRFRELLKKQACPGTIHTEPRP